MERFKHGRAWRGTAVAKDVYREKVDFIETTALRQRRNGGREVTVTSRLHRQKDKERQRKTEEKGDRRPDDV